MAADPIGHRPVKILVAPPADPGIGVGRDIWRRHGAEGGAIVSPPAKGVPPLWV